MDIDEEIKRDQAQDKLEIYEEALWKISQWADAYPNAVFPEPDLKKAAELLRAGGMTLDSVSASAMRHVVIQVSKIAKDALKGKEDLHV